MQLPIELPNLVHPTQFRPTLQLLQLAKQGCLSRRPTELIAISLLREIPKVAGWTMYLVQPTADLLLLASLCSSHSQRESLNTNMRVRMSLILSRIELISAIVSP